MRVMSSPIAVLLLLLVSPAPAAADPLTLDPTFGAGGRVITDPAIGVARDAVLLPDGRIVVCGTNVTGTQFQLVRYWSDGRVDSTFGVDGIVLTTIGGSGVEATGIERQPDGKLVVAGSYVVSPNRWSAVVRYHPDGDLDAGFGTGGRVLQLIGQSSDVRDVVIQPDGRIVIAGSFRPSGTITYVGLRRYHADGRVDSTFGVNGTVARGPGVSHTGADVALQPDGKLVVAGSVTFVSGGLSQVLAFRFLPNGSPDSSFAGFGRVSTDATNDNDYGSAVAIMPDGRIVVSGSVGLPSSQQDRFLLVRFRPDGTRDSTLDADGLALSPVIGNPNGWALSTDMVLLPSGAALVTGQATETSTSDDFAFAQFRADGSMDTNFDGDGVAILDMSGIGRDLAWRVFRQPDGKIVAAGAAGNGVFANGSRMSLARFSAGDPTADAPALGAGNPGIALAMVGANPFGDEARVRFTLAAAADVELAVYDAAGRRRARIASGPRAAGVHTVAWDGCGADGQPVPAGVWFVRMRAHTANGTTRSATLRAVRVR